MTRRTSVLLAVLANAIVLACALWLLGGGCRSWADDRTSEELPFGLERLRELHRPLGAPMPGDWLARYRERGQTWRQWRASSPVTPTGERQVLYIQPIGAFTPDERRIVELTVDFLARYFDRPARLLDDLPDERIPARARRVHPEWNTPQVLTTYVLDDVLKPALPDDAATLIAFTASDLWPGDGWNFVFGQASLRDRVGVWSIHRNGDPTASDAAFRLCLLRTIKTATHETGHMFSIAHCTAYECNMCGSNHRAESDRHPLACCPECVAKICDATGADPAARFERLAAFCASHGLEHELAFYSASLRALRAN